MRRRNLLQREAVPGPAHRNPMPRIATIQVVNDLTRAAAATANRAGDGRGRAPDLAGESAARQPYLARELVPLAAAESFVEA